MRTQILLLLLFPLALTAQQRQNTSVPANGAAFLEDTLTDTAQPVLPSESASVAVKTSLPEAPRPQPNGAIATATYETTWLRRPEPAFKDQKIFDKKFIAVHAALLGSMVYDAELTHQGLAHHKCVESNVYLGRRPGRGEIYGQDALAFGAISSLDWIAAKFVKISYLPLITPTVETAVHLTGGSRWLTECW